MTSLNRAQYPPKGRLTVIHADASVCNETQDKPSGIGIVIKIGKTQMTASWKAREKDSCKAELRAACEALRLIEERNLAPAILIVDSKNTVSVLHSITNSGGWSARCRKKFYRRYGNLFTETKELLLKNKDVWVRWQGRCSSRGSRLADELARKASGVYRRQMKARARNRDK